MTIFKFRKTSKHLLAVSFPAPTVKTSWS